MGIQNILDAHQILLVAFGAAKRDALTQALAESVTEACPASTLQIHPHVTVIADREALGSSCVKFLL